MMQIQRVANGYTVLLPVLASDASKPRTFVATTERGLLALVRMWLAEQAAKEGR